MKRRSFFKTFAMAAVVAAAELYVPKRLKEAVGLVETSEIHRFDIVFSSRGAGPGSFGYVSGLVDFQSRNLSDYKVGKVVYYAEDNTLGFNVESVTVEKVEIDHVGKGWVRVKREPKQS